MVKSVTLDIFNSKIILGTIAGDETEYTVQEVGSLIKEQLQLAPFIDDDAIFRWSGFDELPAGDRTGVVLILQNAWQFSTTDPGGVHAIRISRGVISRHDNTVPVDTVNNITWVFADSTVSSLANAQTLEDLKFIIELANRATHTGFGKVIYWNPTTGDDGNTGKKESEAVKTFSKAHDLVDDGGHDMIFLLPNPTLTPTIITENVSITKDSVFLRGSGIHIQIKPTSGVPITISGHGCQIENLTISGADTGNNFGIDVSATGNAASLRNLTVEDTQDIAINIVDADNCKVENCIIRRSGGNGGVSLADTKNVIVKNTSVIDCTNDGFYVTATVLGASDHNTLIQCQSLNNGGYGLEVANANVTNLSIDPMSFISSQNTLGRIIDNGVDTQDGEVFNIVSNLSGGTRSMDK